MDRGHIRQLLILLDADKIIDRSEWVMTSCLFAPWTHSKGTDSRPSFGISVGRQSHYHCFSCQRSGPLPMLVTSLCMLRGQDNLTAREFVMNHEDLSVDPYEDLKDGEPLTVLSKTLLKKFCPAHTALTIIKKRGISQEMIDLFHLRYDPKEARLIFPIYSGKGDLVGFRGRAAGDDKIKYREYSELCPKKQSMKGHGIWFGMQHVPPVNQKVIIVEGELDAIKLTQALGGRFGVWASMGASISEEQIKVLQALKNPILLFLDNDEAGRVARDKILLKLKKVKTGIFEITDYSGCKDPDEIVTKGALNKAFKSMEMVG
jgi:hypothetical protein